MIAFISNSINDNVEGWVLPWQHFKKKLTQIYDDWIAFQSEIGGHISSNYLSFEEFIILYFLRTYKLWWLAEMKLIEFLSSLKYFCPTHKRAAVFAKITGILAYSDPVETDVSNFSCDIYL